MRAARSAPAAGCPLGCRRPSGSEKTAMHYRGCMLSEHGAGKWGGGGASAARSGSPSSPRDRRCRVGRSGLAVGAAGGVTAQGALGRGGGRDSRSLLDGREAGTLRGRVRLPVCPRHPPRGFPPTAAGRRHISSSKGLRPCSRGSAAGAKMADGGWARNACFVAVQNQDSVKMHLCGRV